LNLGTKLWFRSTDHWSVFLDDKIFDYFYAKPGVSDSSPPTGFYLKASSSMSPPSPSPSPSTLPLPLLKIVPGYQPMPKCTNSAQEQGRANITRLHPIRSPFPPEQTYNLCPTRTRANVIRIISNTLPSHRVGRLNPRL
jgi:hypothetical protein